MLAMDENDFEYFKYAGWDINLQQEIREWTIEQLANPSINPNLNITDYNNEFWSEHYLMDLTGKQ